jgi:hypothetical protein
VDQATEITVSDLDHLGLIAGLVDEIGIVQKINELLGEQRGEIVSPGLAVKAMIINGLGLSILRTAFETEAETLILPLALDLTEKAESRTMPLVTENCPDHWVILVPQKYATIA